MFPQTYQRVLRAEVGNIIIAEVNGKFTVKRFKREYGFSRNGLRLVPANIRHDSIKVCAGDEFEIVGVVTLIIHPAV